MDSVVAQPLANLTAGGNPNKDVPKAQDLHCMLDKVFESYIKLQNSGFLWDLYYKNQMYYNAEFVLFTPFIKVDSDEAEKLCGNLRHELETWPCFVGIVNVQLNIPIVHL